MSVDDEIARHYTSGSLLDRIRAGLAQAGCDPDRPAPEDLKEVDEFHIGGVEATRALLSYVDIGPGDRLLDLGSGLGGPARCIAAQTGCHVTGIDLTPEFVATATELSRLTGLSDRTSFVQGSALDLPFETDSFDAATLIHVGMNLPDKPALFAGVARALKPGGTFIVYDVMHTGPGEIAFPVPWAETSATDFSAAPEVYHAAAEAAGFSVTETHIHRDRAIAFFAARKAALERQGGPPPLGLHLIVGETAREKVANMAARIAEGTLAPVEMICRLPG